MAMKSATEATMMRLRLTRIITSATRATTSNTNRRLLSAKNLSSQSNKNGGEEGSVARERVDCLVIGAGVVGLAVARELAAKKRRKVILVDSAPTFGTGTSSRNSEVIHAGIYYPPSSFKALFCVRGRELLYSYCREHDIPHKQIGKLIVATGSSEIPKLNSIMNRGIENGVDGLRMIEGYEALRIEPELQCSKALLSPVSGIIDTHSLMLTLVGEAEGYGTTLSYNTAVVGGHLEGNHLCVHISESKALENWDGKFPLQPELVLIPKLVVNSTGLGAPSLAKRFSGIDTALIPTSYYARGCYFTLANTKGPPFRHLIYPIPEDGGLGVHVTLDLNGQVKFGPDVEWINGGSDTSILLNKSCKPILPRDKKVLSQFEGWISGAWLCWHPTQTFWSQTGVC
ncbi:L-2-hydroxyglutarate dehydrogenase, mitochondrial isoform X2 [Diospyros lotus]|uniref:L-2-hydroxyglutarate dehydrogenase, mitochondrial isoform X2 n=1 Tax=Diospyros lotus TaxID=55363 RepID=UPI00224F79C5|nr:L-2-hydroxyglutarate dehydrogenase, mitochondrial isoform X2 [Diospyros lotus]